MIELTICSALSASCTRRAATAASALAVLCTRFIVSLDAFLAAGCTSLFLEAEGSLDVVLDENGGELLFFSAVASDGSGLAYTIKERIFLVVERVVAGIASLNRSSFR